jgi:hypothetical protein
MENFKLNGINSHFISGPSVPGSRAYTIQECTLEALPNEPWVAGGRLLGALFVAAVGDLFINYIYLFFN